MYGGILYEKYFFQTSNYVLFHLSGHTHQDRHDFSDNVLSIGLTSDGNYRDDTDDKGNIITRNKVDDHACDVITIDFDENKIKTVRVGVGKSKEWSFQKKFLNKHIQLHMVQML